MYKAIPEYKTSKRGPLTEMKHLLPLIHEEKYMYWTRYKDNSNIVVDIFWTHLDSMKLLNMFYLVLVFYYTYNTKRYWILQK